MPSDPPLKLFVAPVRTPEQAQQMRHIRNQCRSYMTRHTSFITKEDQELWWRGFNPLLMSAYLYLVDGDPVGYGLITCEGLKCWVSGGLLPNWRDKGLGRQIFEHLTRECWVEPWLEVRADNTRAKKVYERLGYRETGESDGVVTMRKPRAAGK